MIDALKFVKGAVSTKSFQPELKHFLIRDGRIMGYNGTIALSSPIDLDLVAAPNAEKFVKAIERCGGNSTALHVTPGGRLAVKSGRFRAYIECSEDVDLLDTVEPSGEDVELAGSFLEALAVLERFVSTDASRPWAMGILLRNQSAYATNNVILAEYWIGENLPDINIPASAIKELKRIGQEPLRVQLSKNTVTFHFEGGRWLRSQLLNSDWPDVGALLDKASADATPTEIREELFDLLEDLRPFTMETNAIYFRENAMMTFPEEGEGATVEVEGMGDHGVFNVNMLALLKNVAVQADFTRHPNPCPFYGHKVRGVILGMRETHEG